jgi:hypothetical protein
MSLRETALNARKLEVAGSIISNANRVVLLNALPLNAIDSDVFTINCVRFKNVLVLKELAKNLEGKTILNYIRHESTARLISRLIGAELKPTAELYKHESGDAMIIATLKSPIRGAEVEVKEGDLELYVCVGWGGRP